MEATFEQCDSQQAGATMVTSDAYFTTANPTCDLKTRCNDSAHFLQMVINNRRLWRPGYVLERSRQPNTVSTRVVPGLDFK